MSVVHRQKASSHRALNSSARTGILQLDFASLCNFNSVAFSCFQLLYWFFWHWCHWLDFGNCRQQASSKIKFAYLALCSFWGLQGFCHFRVRNMWAMRGIFFMYSFWLILVALHGFRNLRGGCENDMRSTDPREQSTRFQLPMWCQELLSSLPSLKEPKDSLGLNWDIWYIYKYTCATHSRAENMILQLTSTYINQLDLNWLFICVHDCRYVASGLFLLQSFSKGNAAAAQRCKPLAGWLLAASRSWEKQLSLSLWYIRICM